MEINDAINLIDDESLRQPAKAVWADLGCGSGLFSYALANILQPGSMIYAVDKVSAKLKSHQNLRNILIKQKRLDFITGELELINLDGILMANSLHFVKNKKVLIKKLSDCLKENCGFLIVEYDTDNPYPWVPYPISFLSLKKNFTDAGYDEVRKINERPSALRTASIYAAIITR